MATSLRDQVIALAGIAQAAQLVDRIARTGEADPLAYKASISSLFQFDPANTEAVFGGIEGIGYGLAGLEGILKPTSTAQLQVPARYVSGMVYLENRLARRSDMLEIIHNRLEHAAFNANHFDDDPNGLAHSIAAIYQDTVSKFKYRIQVSGDATLLQNTVQADKIRSLLLAGIRSAMLWRQVGGSRWHLLVRKRAIQTTVAELRQTITH